MAESRQLSESCVIEDGLVFQAYMSVLSLRFEAGGTGLTANGGDLAYTRGFSTHCIKPHATLKERIVVQHLHACVAAAAAGSGVAVLSARAAPSGGDRVHSDPTLHATPQPSGIGRQGCHPRRRLGPASARPPPPPPPPQHQSQSQSRILLNG